MSNEYTFVPATELRQNSSEMLNRVAYGDEELVLTRRGKPIAALISLAALETLHRLEDAADLAEAELGREDIEREGAIPWEDVKARFRDD
jgi:prevent-host-death family protein